jgi:hypothetical protein
MRDDFDEKTGCRVRMIEYTLSVAMCSTQPTVQQLDPLAESKWTIPTVLFPAEHTSRGIQLMGMRVSFWISSSRLCKIWIEILVCTFHSVSDQQVYAQQGTAVSGGMSKGYLRTCRFFQKANVVRYPAGSHKRSNRVPLIPAAHLLVWLQRMNICKVVTAVRCDNALPGHVKYKPVLLCDYLCGLNMDPWVHG